MADSYGNVLTETYEIITNMGNEYINKIPKEIWRIIRENRNEDYNFSYDSSKRLSKQNIKKATITLLSYINLNYWCNSEERKELKEIYKRNEQKLEEKKRIKYDSDNILKIMQTDQIKISKNKIKYIPYSEIQKDENIIRKEEDKNSIEYLLKNKKIAQETSKNQAMSVVKKENYLSKLISKIKKLFKKNTEIIQK